MDIRDAITCVYIYYDIVDVEYKIIKKLLEDSNVDIKLIMTVGANKRDITAFNHKYFKEWNNLLIFNLSFPNGTFAHIFALKKQDMSDFHL